MQILPLQSCIHQAWRTLPWPMDQASLSMLSWHMLILECIYNYLTEEIMAMKRTFSEWNLVFPVHFGHQTLTLGLLLNKFNLLRLRLLNIVGASL